MRWAALAKQWFLIALTACFLTGYVAAEALQPWLQASWFRAGVMFVVMWSMGVTLRAGTIRRSVTHPLPAGLGIGINLAVVPLLALPARWWLPEPLFGGLFIAAIVPCTLAAASVWTRKAGGDDSVAMMTTVVTNLACVVVIPLGIWLVLAEQASVDAGAQVGKLALLVVTPLALAQLMRRLGLAAWADQHRSGLSVIAQCGMLIMVVLGAAASGYRVGDSSSPGDSMSPATDSTWLTGMGVVAAVFGIHVSALAAGVIAARVCGLDRARQIAVGVSGSQKSLMVGLQIAIDCGLSTVPMLIYHLVQLTFDTLIVQRWKRGRNDGT